MEKHNIKLILVQIDEAHSTSWPIGLKNTPTPQKTFDERIERAKKFYYDEKLENKYIKIMVDSWKNDFAETFRAWPDKFYLFDSDFKILAKSTYGSKHDAVIDIDCVDLISSLIR